MSVLQELDERSPKVAFCELEPCNAPALSPTMTHRVCPRAAFWTYDGVLCLCATLLPVPGTHFLHWSTSKDAVHALPPLWLCDSSLSWLLCPKIFRNTYLSLPFYLSYYAVIAGSYICVAIIILHI